MLSNAFTSRARARCLGLIAVFVLCVPFVPATAEISSTSVDGGTSSYTFRKTERCLMRRINRVRARHGLRRLQRDKQLAYVARRHARSMASARGVWHDQNVGSKVTRWRRLGQNTGRGRSCRSLTRSFMRSSSHRAHILGRFRYFAVGTERAGGRVYVQELFESRRNPGNIYNTP